MKRRLATLTATLLAITLTASAQGPIHYTPVTCVKGGEMPVLQLNVADKGELRCYFRRVNTTDWCSVEGVNDGPLSRVVLPKFDAGDEIEYFFLLLDGKRVVARSEKMYRASVAESCQTATARHIAMLTMSCGDDASIPSAIAAAYAVDDEFIAGNPPTGSPDRPVATTTKKQ
jgi:hypothetical protein